MIFIHDHTFIKKDARYYTSGSLNNNLFDRYLQWFDEISVVANERLATDKDNKIICNEIEVNNVEFILFKKSNNPVKIFNSRKIIQDLVYKQDYIIVRIPSIYGIMAIRYARKFKKTYLIEVVGCPWDSLWNHGWKGKIFAPFMWLATKYIAYNAPFAIYVTNEFLQLRYPCKGKSIGCSDVSLPTVDESVLERRLNKIEKLAKNDLIIIGTTAAVNVSYKGQEYVIHAISQLNKEGYNYEYHLAGGGDSSYLKSVAKKFGVINKVKFIGSVPHEKVFDYLDSIDIYIQPSKQEGLPRALVEAMSRGCPSLGSTTGGIPELLNKDYIFNNAAVNEIIILLKKLDKDIMIKEAKRSFSKAQEYNKELLDIKRNTFYTSYIDNVSNIPE